MGVPKEILKKRRFLAQVVKNNVPRIGLLLFLVFIAFTPGMFSWITMVNVLKSAIVPAVVSLGLLCVVITGKWDMSIGSVAGLVGTATCYVISVSGGNTLLGISVGFIVALVCGVANGLLISYAEFQDMVTTVATSALMLGASYLFAGGYEIYKNLGPSFAFLFSGYLGPVPFVFCLVAGLYLIFHFILHRSAWGRSFFAAGGNEQAAYYSGINVRKIRFWGYVLAGLLAGVGGVLGASEHMRSWVLLGQTYVLTGYCIVFLGSALLGRFTVAGTLIAAVLLSILKNWIVMAGFAFYIDSVLTGVFLLIAVVLVPRVESAV
jgi:ribose transport system permease protein